jgi:type VI secretion system secreted protein VgrG
VIRGPQTAIVVGSSGNEIDTDAYGRVRLHFHWDRYDQKDQNSSCFVRVAQVWAGKQWGSIFIPRINQEVIVEFLEGDPDRPIITGGVYNADQTVPVALPTNKTQSGILTRSTTGGSTTNFNQLLFEDKKGSEQISVQAEKDMVINIKNNRTETIGAARSLTIKSTDTKEVDDNVTETYKGTVSQTVSKDVTQTFQGALGQTVSKDVTLTFQGALNETVSKDVTETYQGALSQTVSKDVTDTFQGGHTEQTTKVYSLQADTVSITGQTKITLTVGGNSITIDSSGITVNSSATLSLQGSGSTSVKGATISIG